MNKKVGIYKITSPSGKVYIGQSWDIANRFGRYGYVKHWRKQPALAASFIKYGIKSHLFEIISLLPSDVSQDVLDNYECIYIEYYKGVGSRMMNIRDGGSRGKHTESSKNKIRNTLTGRKRPQEVVDKLVEASKRISEEDRIVWCTKGGLAAKGKITSEEAKKNISLAQPTRTPVCFFNANGEMIGVYKSVNEAARRTGLFQSNISLAIKQNKWHKRFYFKATKPEPNKATR